MEKMTLCQIRVHDGKSKRQYAETLNIPYTTYCRYENRLGSAPFDVVAKICNVLKINIKEIKW